MPTVYEDLQAGWQISESYGDQQVTRVFRVSNLTAAPELQLMQALDQPEIPDYGDLFPFGDPVEYPQFSSLVVRERTTEPMGPQAARITCIYRNRRITYRFDTSFAGNEGPETRYTVGGSVTTTRTTKDITDTAMTVTPPAAVSNLDPFDSEATIFEPVFTLQFDRLEKTPPTQAARDFVGKLNSASLGSGAYAAKTLLCVAINGPTDDGEIYRCTYQFRYKETGWQHTDFFRQRNGKPYAGATVETWDVLPTANFSTLGLDFND